MRILILTQWFDPEPIFKGLAFAKELRSQGHEVEVLTGFPNYPGGALYPGYRLRLFRRENVEGIPVIRVALFPSHDDSALKRTANYLSFAFCAALLGPFLVRKADVMYVYHPPASVALPAGAIGLLRGIPFVYDIMDIWPDSLAATRMIRSSALLELVGFWCRLVYRWARRITVISDGFKTRLEAEGVPPEKVSVIYNWCDEVQLKPGDLPPDESALLHGRFNVVFAGNMGKVQGLDVVLDAARPLQVSQPKVQFVLVGSGVDLPRIRREVLSRGLANVLILPGRPVARIGAVLRAADALLVHLKADPLFEITIPSKIQAYLAVGRPILAGVEGDAAVMVREARAGLLFKPDDAAGLVSAIEALLSLSEAERRALGGRGAAYYKERLSIAAGVRRFVSIFESARNRESV